jgi:hypothetical protein
MSMLFALARMTMLYTPFAEPILGASAKDALTEAMLAFERGYAHELGYTLGPQGQWIARSPDQQSNPLSRGFGMEDWFHLSHCWWK